jgi:AraC-like DNA-binding protein
MNDVSASHLASLFRRELGVTIHRYLLGRRLEEARRLLRSSDVPITTIANDLGFSSGQHLATAFRKQYGRSPRDARRRHRDCAIRR